MNIRSLYFAALTAILVSGCATPYKQSGLMGGFTETQLDENVYKVSFRGNGYTSGERAEELALLRSADLTMRKGYKYFVLADSNSDSKIASSYTAPVTSHSNSSAYAVGNTVYGSSTTTSYGGHTQYYVKPSTTNTVVMFREKPQATGLVYSAEFLCKSLARKYGAGCGRPRQSTQITQ